MRPVYSILIPVCLGLANGAYIPRHHDTIRSLPEEDRVEYPDETGLTDYKVLNQIVMPVRPDGKEATPVFRPQGQTVFSRDVVNWTNEIPPPPKRNKYDYPLDLKDELEYHMIDERNQRPGDQSMNDEQACTFFRGMMWFVHNQAQQEAHSASDVENGIPKVKADQSGQFVRLLRSVMAWTRMLQSFRFQLEKRRTYEWGPRQQLQVANCYTDYSLEVGAWIGWMRREGRTWNKTSEERCIMHDRLKLLYEEYQLIGLRLYGDYLDSKVKTYEPKYREILFDSFFPELIPDWWDSTQDEPRPGDSIGFWVHGKDAPFPWDGLFPKLLKDWTCRRKDYPNGPQKYKLEEAKP